MNRAKIIINLCAIAIIIVANLGSMQAQNKTEVLNLTSIADHDAVTDIYLSSSMLKSGKFEFKNSDLPSLEDIMGNTESIRILSSNNKQGLKRLQDAFSPICNGKSNLYKTFFSVKSDGAKINLIGKMQRSAVDGLYLIVDDNQEIAVIIFDGSYTQQQIENMLAQANSRRSTKAATKNKNASQH